MARRHSSVVTSDDAAQTRRIRSFAPVARQDAETLILGSMPGVASLAAGQYYAHPRNAFWPILAKLLRIDPVSAYDERLRALVAAKIALWDVLQSCERSGSLDTSIHRSTQQPNDFRTFFRTHPRITRVVLNGTKAYDTFRRCVHEPIPGERIEVFRVPSTSPANASWSFDRKLEAWQAALGAGVARQLRVSLR